MQTVALTKEQEEKWLDYIKNDTDSFFTILFDRLKEYNNIEFKFSNHFLQSLYLKNIQSNNDKYCKLINLELPENRYKKELLDYIDFGNFEYQHLYLDQNTIDFIKNNNIVLDLDCIYNKDISNLKISEMIIQGYFDDFNISGCTIMSNARPSGNVIKINPKKIINMDLSNCTIENVRFTDNFDDCIIHGISLKNNINTFINPQRISDKDLSNCKIKNAKFTDNFDSCDLFNTTLEDNYGVIINPQLIKNKNFQDATISDAVFTHKLNGCRLVNTTFYKNNKLLIDGKGLFRHHIDFFKFDNLTIFINDYVDYNSLINFPKNLFIFDERVIIETDEEYYIKLKNYDAFKKCRYRIIHSNLESDIDGVFKNINNEISNSSKKKRLFKGRKYRS